MEVRNECNWQYSSLRGTIMMDDFFTVNFNPKGDTILPKDWYVKPYTDSICIRFGYGLNSLVTDSKAELIKTPPVKKYSKYKHSSIQIFGFSKEDIKVLEGDYSDYFLHKLKEVKDVITHKYFGCDAEKNFFHFHVTDDLRLCPFEFSVSLFGVEYFKYETKGPDYILAIDTGDSLEPIEGVKTIDPLFNLDAYWIPIERFQNAIDSGYLITDVTQLIILKVKFLLERNLFRFVKHETVSELMGKVVENNPSLVSEILEEKNIPISFILKIVKLLLKDGIPIYNFETILETIALYINGNNIDEVYRKVRGALAPQIFSYVADENRIIKVATFSSEYLKELEIDMANVEDGSFFTNATSENIELLKTKIIKVSSSFVEYHLPIVFLVPPEHFITMQKYLRSLQIEEFYCFSTDEIDVEIITLYKLKIVYEITKEGIETREPLGEKKFSPLVQRERWMNFFYFKGAIAQFIPASLEKYP